MISIPDFHDGYFDGLWVLDQNRVHLFLRTMEKDPFTLVLHGAKRLHASNVQLGNIVLELFFIENHDIAAAHIEEVCGLSIHHASQVEKVLSNVKRDGLTGIKMTASYGAELIALFERAELLSEHLGRKWPPDHKG